jgi:HEAT repeat protein
MKHMIAVGSMILFCLALAANGDAQTKKKKEKEADDQVAPRADEVPKYLKMLTAGNSKERVVAANKIGLRGMINATDVASGLEPLKKMLEKDADPDVRKAAARALGNIQPDAADTVPLLTKTVKGDKVLNVRIAATVALGQYGAEARPALPTLREFAGEITDKKSMNLRTIQAAIKSISGKKK